MLEVSIIICTLTMSLTTPPPLPSTPPVDPVADATLATRFCRKFSSAVIDGMISLRDRWWQERGKDDAGKLQGGPFPTGYYSDGCTGVCGVSLELSACRRTDGGARGASRPRDHPALGRQVQCSVGRGIPLPQAPGGTQLVDG